MIDLVTIYPMGKETVLESVKKTGHLCICHEAVKQGGFGAEIAATAAEEAFDSLKGPVLRLAAPFTPVPFAPSMENKVRVHVDDIVNAITKTLKG